VGPRSAGQNLEMGAILESLNSQLIEPHQSRAQIDVVGRSDLKDIPRSRSRRVGNVDAKTAEQAGKITGATFLLVTTG